MTELCNAAAKSSSTGDYAPTAQVHDVYKTTIRYAIILHFSNRMRLRMGRFMSRNYEITLQDTAGMENYDRLLQLTCDRADVLLICARVGSKADFRDIENVWATKIELFGIDKPHILVCAKGGENGKNLRPRRRDEVSQGADEASCDAFAASLAKVIGISTYMVCDLSKVLDVRRLFYEVKAPVLCLPFPQVIE